MKWISKIIVLRALYEILDQLENPKRHFKSKSKDEIQQMLIKIHDEGTE